MADYQEIRKRVLEILNTGDQSNPSFNIRQNRAALEMYLQGLGLPYEEAVGFTTLYIAQGLGSSEISSTTKKVVAKLEELQKEKQEDAPSDGDPAESKPSSKGGKLKSAGKFLLGGTWGALKLGGRAVKAGGGALKAGGAAAGRAIKGSGGGLVQDAVEQPGGFQTFILFALIASAAFFFAIGMVLYAIAAVFFLILWAVLSRGLRQEFLNWEGGLFIFMLFIHVMLFKAGFAFNTQSVFLVLLIFVPWMLLVLFFAEDKRFYLTRLLIILVFTLLIYALPSLATKFVASEVMLQTAVYVAAILPLPSIYLLHQIGERNQDGYAQRILHWYLIWGLIIPMIIFAVVGLLKAQDMVPQFDLGKADTRTGFGGFIDTVKESTQEAWKKVTGDYKQYTDPGAYYTGRVEENKLKPNGVEILRFRPQDKTVSNESPIIVHGVVTAKSFIGTEIEVQPSCLIDRKNAPEASVDPTILEVIYGTGQTFTCSFPPLKAGTYTVKGAVTFPFETWSYITYTFVDRERAMNIAKQQRDVNTELDIPDEAVATFTSGPIMVGMGGSTQPILVNPAGTPILQPGSSIGITIEPAWEGGKLQRVDRFELKVPAPFLLDTKRCDRNLTEPPTPDVYAEGYTNYVFQNPDEGPITTYTSVTCPLLIDDEAQAALLVTEADKTERSFIAVVRYWYTIDEKTTVQVK